MRDLEDDDPLKFLVDSFAQMQGGHMAVYHILLELTLRISAAQSDPSAFLKSMYEAISTKLDQTPFDTEEKASSGHERETLATFFSVADTAWRKRRGKGPPETSAR